MQVLKRRQWLKDLRNAKGLTIRQIAPLLNISFSHYSDIENGRKNPSLNSTKRIADFFEIDIMTILNDRFDISEKNSRQKENE